MARTADEIVALFHDRRKQRGTVISYMEEIRAHYNGDIVIPLPEMDTAERNYVANFVSQGIDSYGTRIASVLPQITVPPTDPRRESSRKRADTRRKAYYGWWESNRMGLALRQRARYLVGYGSAPVIIKPDFDKGIPRWDRRNPLTCYPAQCNDETDLTPDDCIFAVKLSLREIRQRWPDKARLVADDDTPPDMVFNVLEYSDSDILASVLVGPDDTYRSWRNQRGLPAAVELASVPNRTGVCLAVVPGRITLDRLSGQFDQILGTYQMRAKLMALEVLAVEKGVFPQVYLETKDPNQGPATFISGPHTGSSGLVNIVQNGVVRTLDINPGFATNGTVDRLERTERVQAGIPSEFGGESGTNIRTGRRGDAVLSAVVDFPIQEMQEILAASLAEENRRRARSRSRTSAAPRSRSTSSGRARPAASTTSRRRISSRTTTSCRTRRPGPTSTT
jgi:hypothetical protein